MNRRVWLAAIFSAIFSASFLAASSKDAPKPIPSAEGENEDLILQVKLYIDGEAVKQLLGDDLGGHYIVADVSVQPKYGKDVAIDRDDFLLRTNQDGDKTHSYVASQVVDNNAVVKLKSDGRGKSSPFGPGETITAQVTVKEQGEKEPSPLEKLLNRRILPEGKSTEPVSGLLYFPMEKQKLKDLELVYGDTGNRIRLRFVEHRGRTGKIPK
ncbi:MAG: hypothetical protein ABSH49_09105 [Bryobacteraceae bacterium]|jgi:hypothetical protein